MPRTKILGILNVTPDSFSDGGRYLAPDAALAHARFMVAAGADVIDIGAASSHPDAAPVRAEDEIVRLAPVLKGVKEEGLSVSVDSCRTDTQRYALAQGVDMLNDIHGFADADFYPELADASCRLVVMHAVQEAGKATRRRSPDNIYEHVSRFFDARLNALTKAGILQERLVLDPGMGFFLGNAPEASLTILTRLPDMKARFGMPILISVSRKYFLRVLTGCSIADAGAASLAAELYASAQGADYIRTHEPAALSDALRIREALDAT